MFVGGDGTISTLNFPKVATEDLGLYQLKVDLEGERIESDPIALRIIGNTYSSTIYEFQIMTLDLFIENTTKF